ncbi:MAG: hypothetical protein SGILL_005787 [Bacillariaceae sp.]
MANNSTTRRQRRLVLSEEDYTSTLSSIVQRDYFPQIVHLERQNELLDARSKGDVAGAVAVRRDTRRWMKEEEAKEERRRMEDQDVINTEGRIIKSESSSNHSDVTRCAKTGIRKLPRQLSDENLTGFHARVTNEDDQEFDSNQKQENQTNRRRLEGLFQPHAGSAASNGSSPYNNSQHLLEMASDDFAPESNRNSPSEWKEPSMKNEFFFNPTPLRGASQPDQHEAGTKLLTNGGTGSGFPSVDAAPAYGSTTALMLPPSESQTKGMLRSKNASTVAKDEPRAMVVSSAASHIRESIDKSQLVEYIPKHCLEKRIEPSQTRFPSSSDSVIPVPNGRAGAIVRHGNRQQYNDGLLDASDTDNSSYVSSADEASYYSTDLDAPLRPVEQERARRLKRQRKEQKQQHRSYVAMTPQIIPGTAGNLSPITTWGTIEDTPLVLSGKGTVDHQSQHSSFPSLMDSKRSSSILMTGETQREKNARNAEMELERRSKKAKQASTKARKKKMAASKTAPLTPAAMSLLQKTQRVSSRSRDAFGSSLRGTYSSKPSRQRHTTASIASGSNVRGTSLRRLSNRDHAYNTTPQF